MKGCPNCGRVGTGGKYCRRCGRAADWKDAHGGCPLLILLWLSLILWR